ncbi:MAG: antibiotic biosynthesis monooxygenase [Acidobacteriota bacterium]
MLTRSVVNYWFRTLVLITVLVLVEVSLQACALAQTPSRGNSQGFPDLVSGLKATPGCLGVETARTQSGKNVIFAWFEDKQAVLNWYYSEMHQQVVKTFFSNHTPRGPLQGVPDDIGPIMAIASITMAEKPQFERTSLPISQISIELYTPLTGGLFLGSRFAPDTLKVPEISDFTPKK